MLNKHFNRLWLCKTEAIFGLIVEQGTVQQPPETTEEFNSTVPELEVTEPNTHFFSQISLTNCLSNPPKLFEFNTASSTDTLQVPLKPIILLTLFWMSMLNIIQFWYTLFVVELFFLAVSCVGIFAVIKRRPNFLSHFCWARLFVDIIELVVDFVTFVSFSIGRHPSVLVFSVFLGIIIKYFLKAFFLYCVVKYWDSIRQGYVILDENPPFATGPINRQ